MFGKWKHATCKKSERMSEKGGRVKNSARKRFVVPELHSSHRHRHHSPRARQKSRKASWACTPQAWSFSRGGNSLTSASRASTLWGLVEEEVEEEEEEEEDREDEVSTGEEAVREGVMGKESIEENGKSNKKG